VVNTQRYSTKIRRRWLKINGSFFITIIEPIVEGTEKLTVIHEWSRHVQHIELKKTSTIVGRKDEDNREQAKGCPSENLRPILRKRWSTHAYRYPCHELIDKPHKGCTTTRNKGLLGLGETRARRLGQHTIVDDGGHTHTSRCTH